MAEENSEPFGTECTNLPGHTHWTCPGCYADIQHSDISHSMDVHTCPECERKLRLSIVHEPAYKAELVKEETANG